MRRPTRRTLAVPVALALTLSVAACGGETISDATSTPSATPTGEPCGPVDIAVNPWVGYQASAAVVAEVATSRLGCQVTLKDLKEEISWQGFGTGEVDVVLENWGHEDLKKTYIEEQKVAVDFGPNGNIGVIGWYVAPWMVEQYPDITDWTKLNGYASLFKTSESGDLGQLLDGDPSFVTNDEALVKNLDLDYKVVYAGSEAALITAFRQAEKDRTPIIGYFYEPQWFLAEVPLVKVDLPAYTPGCDADPAKVACDYPEYILDKVVSKDFAESGSPAVDLVKAFSWTNDDQNTVAKFIAADGMTPQDAAKKWVADNPEKVDAWLK